MKTDTGAFDLAEPHIWATDDLRWTIKSRHLSTLIGQYPKGVVKHAQTCMMLYPKQKDRLYKVLGTRTDLWAGWAKVRGLPLITSNFCQPHFEGMWHDVQWHQRMTGVIR